MASRIMHYVIACELMKKIPIRDRHSFILGNLEPDIVDKANGEYDRSHFAGESGNSTKGINWSAFIDKYKNQILEKDELLGYLSHLIADACWLKMVRDPNVRKYSGEARKAANSQGYAEMHLYNGILVEKFQLKNEILHIEEFAAEEVNTALTDSFLNELAKDFQETVKETVEFRIYPYEQVLNWLGYTVKKISDEIIALRTDQPGDNPKHFYVKK